MHLNKLHEQYERELRGKYNLMWNSRLGVARTRNRLAFNDFSHPRVIDVGL